MLEQIPFRKRFGPAAIFIAVLTGGPLAAAYIMTRHNRVSGYTKYNALVWLLAILLLALFITVFIYYPLNQHFPWYMFLADAGLAWWMVNHFRAATRQHLEQEGRLFSVWHGLLVGILFFLLTAVISILSLFLHDVTDYIQQNP